MYTVDTTLSYEGLTPQRALYVLVEVKFAGQTFRWSTQPVSILNSDGEWLRFDGGLNELEHESFLQTLSDSPDQNSISLDLLWPVDVAKLVSEGHDLSAATGEVSVWLHSDEYEARQVLIKGLVKTPNYGGFNDPVSFTIEEAPFQDVGLWPRATERVDSKTWPTHREADSGRSYPVIIGRPGVLSRSDGTYYASGTKALVVESDPSDNTQASTLLIAGHRICSDFVQVRWRNPAPGSGYPRSGRVDFGGSGAVTYWGPVEYIQDGLGQWVSVVRVDSYIVPELRQSTHFDIIWAADIGDETKGGLVWKDDTKCARGAGDVMAVALRQSSLRVDWGRLNAARSRMNAWRLDGFISARVQPWEWVVDNLLPLMPVSMHSGPLGLYPVFWRYNALTSDAIDVISWGPGVVRVSNVEYDRGPSELCNSVLLKYGFDSVAGTHQRSVIHGPTADPEDLEQVTSEYSKRSAIRYGRTAKREMTSEIIIDDATACMTTNWMMIEQGFAHRSVEYEVPQRFSYLQLGDVVLLNDEEIHLQGAVALVQGVTLTDTGRIKLTLQLVENVARASRTKGPNPDTGAPDPGVYAGEN